jgi:hypothetical protein
MARWATTTMLAALAGLSAPLAIAKPVSPPPASAAPAGKPNILFVLVDDMGFGDLSVMGNR